MSSGIGIISTVDPLDQWLAVVRKEVNSLRFGAVLITVHESRVVQIETTEKIRLAPSSSLKEPEQSAAGPNLISKIRPRQPEGS